MTVAAEPFVRLSWSQIGTYQQCPAKWWFSRRLPPERTPSALHFGRAVHKALDLFYGARMEGGNVGLDELLSAFKACWDDSSRHSSIKRLTAEAAFWSPSGSDQCLRTPSLSWR